MQRREDDPGVEGGGGGRGGEEDEERARIDGTVCPLRCLLDVVVVNVERGECAL